MLNYAVTMGRFVRDPELRRTDSGKAVCSFTLAVDKPGKDNGASFIPFVAWEKTAEFVEKYFSKGSLIAVESRVESRDYTTKDGQKRTVVELVASQVHFCGKKENNEASALIGFARPTAHSMDFAMIEDEDAELPF